MLITYACPHELLQGDPPFFPNGDMHFPGSLSKIVLHSWCNRLEKYSGSTPMTPINIQGWYFL